MPSTLHDLVQPKHVCEISDQPEAQQPASIPEGVSEEVWDQFNATKAELADLKMNHSMVVMQAEKMIFIANHAALKRGSAEDDLEEMDIAALADAADPSL